MTERDRAAQRIHASVVEAQLPYHRERLRGESFIQLDPVKQSSGKVVTAWAIEGDVDATTIQSNTFTMEWPPKSGRQQEFPEVDRAEWFSPEEARKKLIAAQRGFVDQLESML